jgi:signal transduction histidine kinase
VRLQQAFLNIMLNAVQHVGRMVEQWPAAQATLRITTGRDPRPGGRLWVRFADSGPGIHHRLWEQIFALGFSTRTGGTGLGLFIARSLLESMGGTVVVEQSLTPGGTTFRVELPSVAE